MLALTRKTDYAIIALTHLAKNGAAVCTAREISEKFRVPTALLMNVLKTLGHRDLVKSVRGAHGGYSLSRRPEEISLADIVTAVEGPMRFVQCSGELPAGESPCDLLDGCPVKLPVQRIHDRLQGFLRSITLAEIVDGTGEPQTKVPLPLHGETCCSSGCCQTGSAAKGASGAVI